MFEVRGGSGPIVRNEANSLPVVSCRQPVGRLRYKQSQFRRAGRLDPGASCTNKPNSEGPAAWSDTSMNKQSQLGEARLVSGGRLCETKPIGPTGHREKRLATSLRTRAVVRNKANSHLYADPEIGVPGGDNRAKQSQFAPQRRRTPSLMYPFFVGGTEGQVPHVAPRTGIGCDASVGTCSGDLAVVCSYHPEGALCRGRPSRLTDILEPFGAGEDHEQVAEFSHLLGGGSLGGGRCSRFARVRAAVSGESCDRQADVGRRGRQARPGGVGGQLADGLGG